MAPREGQRTAWFFAQVRWTVGLADEFVVLAMRADPEPMDATRYWQPERPVIKANSDAVILAVSYGLEMQ